MEIQIVLPIIQKALSNKKRIGFKTYKRQEVCFGKLDNLTRTQCIAIELHQQEDFFVNYSWQYCIHFSNSKSSKIIKTTFNKNFDVKNSVFWHEIGYTAYT